MYITILVKVDCRLRSLGIYGVFLLFFLLLSYLLSFYKPLPLDVNTEFTGIEVIFPLLDTLITSFVIYFYFRIYEVSLENYIFKFISEVKFTY